MITLRIVLAVSWMVHFKRTFEDGSLGRITGLGADLQ